MRVTMVTENFLLKLFSLLVAGIMFAFVSWESATPIDVRFPIEYLTTGDMVVTGDPPDTLHATLRGAWANLRTWQPDDLRPIVIDLTDAGPNTHTRRLEISNVQPPAGMTVVSIRPNEVQVEVDRLVEQAIEVQVDIAEMPAFGYKILSARAEPPTVVAKGPSKQIMRLVGRPDQVGLIQTKPIDLGGQEADVQLEVELRRPPAGVRLSQRSVTVVIEIAEELVQRSFPNVRVALRNAPRGTRVSPVAVNVNVKGPRKLVDNMAASALQLVVDVMPEAGEGQNRFEKPVELRDPPERTTLVGEVPRVVVEMPRRRKRR